MGGALRIVTALVVLGSLFACSGVMGLFDRGPAREDIELAERQLAEGRLPEAAASWATLYEAHPTSIEVASAHAYTLLLQGRLDEADAVLAAVDFGRSPEIALRRAMLARRADRLDDVREHGLASGTAAGRVLAAEVMIIDLQVPEAIATLDEVAAGDGVEAATASDYLGLLRSEDPLVRSLANPVALWSLGKRKDACEGAERVLLRFDADASRSEQLLLWAGRAATSGLPGAARTMLEHASSLPDDLRWRLQATEAIVDVAEGDHRVALAAFDRLQGRRGVPADGLADARITACALADDPEVAQALVKGLDSPGAARCLLNAGAVDAARTRRQVGPALGRMLENL